MLNAAMPAQALAQGTSGLTGDTEFVPSMVLNLDADFSHFTMYLMVPRRANQILGLRAPAA